MAEEFTNPEFNDEPYDHPAFAPMLEHHPLQLRKGQKLDYMTDEELRPLFKWNPYDKSQRNKPFGSMQEPASGPPTLPDAPLGGSPAIPASEGPPSLPKSASSISPSWVVNTEVTKAEVIDGDTIKVIMPDGSPRTIRLRNYYAGEMGLTGGREARDALQAILGSGKIILGDLDETEDPSGRTVATVGVEGIPDVGVALAQRGFGTVRGQGDDQGPHGNDWRNLRKHMSGEELARSYDLADKQKKYGMLKRRGKLNTSDPEYQEFLSDMQKFTGAYGGSSKPRTGGSGNPVERAIDALIARRRSPDYSPPEQPKFYVHPEGAREWTQWAKTLNPKERALWDQLRAQEEAFKRKAPSYHKQEYFNTKPYLEHRRLYDKFLHMTTERMRKYFEAHPPQTAPARHRRRRADLPDDLQTALA